MATVNLDTSVRLDIVCRKGDTFTLPIDFQSAIDTTEDNWTLQVRLTDTTEDSTIISINGADNFAISDGTATNSKLTITIAADVMELVDSGLFVYDLENDNAGVVKTYLYGTFRVNEDITV